MVSCMSLTLLLLLGCPRTTEPLVSLGVRKLHRRLSLHRQVDLPRRVLCQLQEAPQGWFGRILSCD